MAQDNQLPLDPVDGQSDEQITEDSKLPEDNSTPFTPAEDNDAILGEAHQATDYKSDIDSTEAYDAGTAAAANAEEPRDPGIEDYTPKVEDVPHDEQNIQEDIA